MKSVFSWKGTLYKLFLVRPVWYQCTGWTGNRPDQHKVQPGRHRTLREKVIWIEAEMSRREGLEKVTLGNNWLCPMYFCLFENKLSLRKRAGHQGGPTFVESDSGRALISSLYPNSTHFISASPFLSSDLILFSFYCSFPGKRKAQMQCWKYSKEWEKPSLHHDGTYILLLIDSGQTNESIHKKRARELKQGTVTESDRWQFRQCSSDPFEEVTFKQRFEWQESDSPYETWAKHYCTVTTGPGYS